MKTLEFDRSNYRSVYVASDGVHSREFPTIEKVLEFVDSYESLFPGRSIDWRFYELHIFQQSK